jgi:hypothetical protein
MLSVTLLTFFFLVLSRVVYATSLHTPDHINIAAAHHHYRGLSYGRVPRYSLAQAMLLLIHL